MTAWVLAAAILVGAGTAVGTVLALAGWRRRLETKLGTTEGELRRLADASVYRDGGSMEVRREIAAFRESLNELRLREQERRVREDETWGTLQRVAAVLVGGQRTGRAGENVLRDAFAHLPPSMVVTDFRVNGRVVEFGLVLPDGRRLAVDSKWTSDRELQELSTATDPTERGRLCRQIEAEVARRAREVSGYLDPAVTAPLAVAVVPDAAYSVLRRAHADAYRRGVVVVSYSLAMPFVLFLYGLMSRLGGEAKARACLADLSGLLDAMEITLENKVSKAATMLSNGAEELRGQVGKARSTVARATLPAPDGQPELLGPGVVFDAAGGEAEGVSELTGLPRLVG